MVQRSNNVTPLFRAPSRVQPTPPAQAAPPPPASRELAHLVEVAPAIAAHVAHERLPAGVRVVALGETSRSALEVLERALALDPGRAGAGQVEAGRPAALEARGVELVSAAVEGAAVEGASIEDGLRRATGSGGPRGRVLALLLGETWSRLDRTAARRSLQGLRRLLLRRDLLLIGAPLPSVDPRGGLEPTRTNGVVLEAAFTLCAATGFQRARDWRSAPYEHALALFAAD